MTDQTDSATGDDTAEDTPNGIRRVWRHTPPLLRKTIIGVIGGSLVVLGLALIVLPGPFTIPLLIAGFAVLGTEFAWAAAALHKVREGLDRGAEIGKAGARRVARAVRRH